MTKNFIQFINQIIIFTDEEMQLAKPLFTEHFLKKGEFWVKEGEMKSDLIFINKGMLRAYFTKIEVEKTFDLVIENRIITSANCYNFGLPSNYCIQAVEDAWIACISKDNLEQLFKQTIKWERVGRIIAEAYSVEQEDRIRSFVADDAQERYAKLAQNQPQLIQRTPQIYLANYLGITPQSLSRLRRNIVANHE